MVSDYSTALDPYTLSRHMYVQKRERPEGEDDGWDLSQFVVRQVPRVTQQTTNHTTYK